MSDLAPIEQTPQPASEKLVNQDLKSFQSENKEKSLPSPLPRISQFPEKVQPVIQETFFKGKAKSEQALRLLAGARSVVDKSASLVTENNKITQRAEEQTPETREKGNKKFEQVKNEIILLQRAYQKLINGQDAPELREIESPFSSDYGWKEEFTDEEIQTYGQPKSILVAGRQAFNKIKPGYYEGVSAFREKLAREYSNRTAALLRIGISADDIKPNFDIVYPHTELGQIPSLPLEEQGKAVEQAIDRFYVQAKTIALDNAVVEAYLAQFESWLGQQSELDLVGNTIDSSTSSKLGTEITRTLHLLKLDMNSRKDRFLNTIKSGPQGFVSSYMTRVGKEVYQLVQDISIESIPIKPDSAEDILRHASFSQDYYELVSGTKEQVVELEKAITQSRLNQLVSTDLSLAKDRMIGVLASADYQAKLDQELPKSDELLYHVGPIQVIRDILKRGILASRKYQIDHFGESTFHSGGMKVGSDYVEFVDASGQTQRMSRSEYAKRPRIAQEKLPDQEMPQVVFSEGGPYMYYQGIAFVFSKSSLFAKSQFMSQDGWHLFPRDYSSEDKDAPGFAIDLTAEPICIVVSEGLKEDFSAFVKDELSKLPAWNIANPDEWIENNVVVVPDGRAHEFTLDSAKKVKDRFWQNHKVGIKNGWVVPSGEKGERATKSLAPLFTYQEAA